jgi:TatD DNase family protein
LQYINLHTHVGRHEDSTEHLEVINQYPSEVDLNLQHYSVGIHPWYIQDDRIDAEIDVIVESIKSNNCIAVGECGLDKRIEYPVSLQLPVFEQQLLIAQSAGKPVIIHCVAAFQEVVEVIKRNNVTIPVIFHGFSKSRQLAYQLLDEGYYLSFGKYLLRNPHLREVFEVVPDDRFFLETDSIVEGIEEVYQLAADYKNMSLEEIAAQVENNFKSVFTTI